MRGERRAGAIERHTATPRLARVRSGRFNCAVGTSHRTIVISFEAVRSAASQRSSWHHWPVAACLARLPWAPRAPPPPPRPSGHFQLVDFVRLAVLATRRTAGRHSSLGRSRQSKHSVAQKQGGAVSRRTPGAESEQAAALARRAAAAAARTGLGTHGRRQAPTSSLSWQARARTGPGCRMNLKPSQHLRRRSSRHPHHAGPRRRRRRRPPRRAALSRTLTSSTQVPEHIARLTSSTLYNPIESETPPAPRSHVPGRVFVIAAPWHGTSFERAAAAAAAGRAVLGLLALLALLAVSPFSPESPFSPFGPGVPVSFSASNFASSSANLSSSDGLQYFMRGYSSWHDLRHFLTKDLLAHRSG